MSESPDFSAIDLGECVSKDFPAGEVTSVGGGLRVALGRRAYDDICKHADEDSDHELCGVLLGDLCRDSDGPFLHITETIRGEHATSQGAQVTITHETWNHFHREKDSSFPDKSYLGWYHTHPDFGVFLSSMDTFIHENFFSAPHQVALVIDPVRREEGLFYWKEGKPAQAMSFWVGRDERKFEESAEPTLAELQLRDVGKKLEGLRARLVEMDDFMRSRSDGGFMQTVVLLGILLLLLLMVGTNVLGGGRSETPFDRARRDLTQIEVSSDDDGKTVMIRYKLLPGMTQAMPSVDAVTGDRFLTIRMPLEAFATRYSPEYQRKLKEAREAREKELKKESEIKKEEESKAKES